MLVSEPQQQAIKITNIYSLTFTAEKNKCNKTNKPHNKNNYKAH
jgi:hypothetical protein